MKANKISKYAVAKNISYEIIIEEQLQLKSEATSTILEKYKKKRISLKLKFISYKIINAIIFILLPLFPILSFLDSTSSLTNAGADVQIIMFIQSLVLQTFIIVQFFDFFLMGVFNLINIMSGEIFDWFKTLPFSRKELKRLTLLTIFHNFDIPILANIFSFPIMILVVTQNFIVFLISLGCSVLNVLFSITILIILGEKIGNVIRLKNKSMRKSLFLQILNVFSYAIIIFGTIFAIQLILSSMISFIIASADLYYSPLYNLILSSIPFPFSPVYSIIYFINFPEMVINLWLSPLIGMVLYAILIYFFFSKAMKSIDNILSLTPKFNESVLLNEDYILKVHKLSPFKAFLKKDLLIASRNLQTFMYFIMPLVMSFVFTIFFNISYAGQGALLGGDLFYNWLVIVGFGPIISGTIVYNILSIENTGKSIIGALPIVNRDQAKAKLVIMILIQFIATLTPTLIYILHPRFIYLLLTTFATLPFIFIFLISIFLFRVRLFGKKKSSYVFDEYAPGNKLSKWIIIFFIQYSIYLLLVSIVYFLYFYFDIFILVINLVIICLILMIVLKGFFDKYFPKIIFKKISEIRKSSKASKWPIIISLVVIIYYLISIFFLIDPTLFFFFSVNPQLFTGVFFVVVAILLLIVSLKIPKKKQASK
ncbi:MAG: hypothetical protein ACFFEO_09110 [Candidatus Thorarchaeota archaeon]